MDNNNTFTLAFKLFIICLVVGVGLAFLNSVTAPKINLAKENEKISAMSEVLPKCELHKLNEAVYKGTSDGKTMGYAVSVTSDKGYGGNIDMIVAFKEDFTVLDIKFIDLSHETPGIGSKVKDVPDFVKRFLGKKDTEIVNGTPKKPNEVEGISGATISSRAVNYGVNKAAEILKEAMR